MSEIQSVRLDSWIWAVRLFKTRSAAAAACRAGHVRVNGTPSKAGQRIGSDDEIRLRVDGLEKIVVVTRVVAKRVGAPVAAECMIDRSPPPPPKEVLASAPRRDRGAGRPTKRERRDLDKLRGLGI
ncbi:RNA-binding S4 domain-containing protein [Rhodococcus sp. P1Y]|uniref:RNA-binding S4 domain-containing protein n=1 Tax=Rhodococcus sp. P1Y TaxID=1302308 RepID=UPI000EAE0809|nr:S4 domain-containing protein [Rhodococcus sp. P1Y]AYJ49958.1 RNA-binding S4 domain-containing protein [Rhodococcus sp. P1Y]